MGDSLFGDVVLPDIPQCREESSTHRCGSSEFSCGAMPQLNCDRAGFNQTATSGGEVDHAGRNLLGESELVC